jgi:hypothetical protein
VAPAAYPQGRYTTPSASPQPPRPGADSSNHFQVTRGLAGVFITHGYVPKHLMTGAMQNYVAWVLALMDDKERAEVERVRLEILSKS